MESDNVYHRQIDVAQVAQATKHILAPFIGRIVRAAIAIFPFIGALILFPVDAVITCARVIKAHQHSQDTAIDL